MDMGCHKGAVQERVGEVVSEEEEEKVEEKNFSLFTL